MEAGENGAGWLRPPTGCLRGPSELPCLEVWAGGTSAWVHLVSEGNRAAPAAYGGCQARGRIGAIVASLHDSHSNSEYEPHPRPTPQLTATPDP